MNKVVNFLGWVGTAVVVVALALRFQTVKPEWAQYSVVRRDGGPGAGARSTWRRSGARCRRPSSGRQTRLGTIAATSVVLVLGILVAVNYLASRRNHRWDLTAGKQFSLADQTRNILQKLDAPVKVLVFDKPTEFDTFRDRLDEYEYLSNRKLTVEYISPDKDPVRANQIQDPVVRDRGLQLQGPHRDGGRHRRAAAHEHADQGAERRPAERLLPAGPRRARHRGERARRLQHDLPGARDGELQDRHAGARAEARGARQCHRARHRGAAHGSAPGRGRRDQAVPRSRRQAARACSIRPTRTDSSRSPT